MAKDDKRIVTEYASYPSPKGHDKTRGLLVQPAKAEGKYDPSTQGAYLLELADGQSEVIPFEKGNMFRDEMRHFAELESARHEN